MSDEFITIIKNPRWELNPGSLEDANESAIISANLFKYFPERYGRLLVPRQSKEDAHLIEFDVSARLSDTSTFFEKKADNLYFIAMSVTQIPGGAIKIDRLHPCDAPPHTREDKEVINGSFIKN